MKKLLSLLSVLTISGTAVPSTIAASPYQKEEINSDINYQQKNNLENLNRVKRKTYTINGNESEFIYGGIFGKQRYKFILTPNLFEELVYFRTNDSNDNSFVQSVGNKIYQDVAKLSFADESIGKRITTQAAVGIKNNWSNIIKSWENTNRHSRILIIVAQEKWQSSNWITEDLRILND